jgi:hypothetical protein
MCSPVAVDIRFVFGDEVLQCSSYFCEILQIFIVLACTRQEVFCDFVDMFGFIELNDLNIRHFGWCP